MKDIFNFIFNLELHINFNFFYLIYLMLLCNFLFDRINFNINIQWRDSRKKYNIQGDIKTLLGKSCEVEKMMRFLIEAEMFEEIQKNEGYLTR